jgi:hypothetical protein
MNFSLKIFNIKLIPTGPDIPLLKPVPLHYAMDMRNRHIMSNIKFSFLIEQGPIDIQLHNEGLLRAVVVGALGFEDGIEFVDLVDDCDAVATVGVLARFNDPDVTHFALLFYSQLHLFLLFLDVGLALLVVG